MLDNPQINNPAAANNTPFSLVPAPNYSSPTSNINSPAMSGFVPTNTPPNSTVPANTGTTVNTNTPVKTPAPAANNGFAGHFADGSGFTANGTAIPAPNDFAGGSSVNGNPSSGNNSTDPNSQIATNAGNAGLSSSDYLNLLGSTTATNTNTLNQIQNNLGIPATANAAFATPAQSTVDVYNQAYNAAGLGDLRQKILSFNDQIGQANQEYINAVGQTNEDPFLSEEARSGRLGNLYNQAQSTIGNLINEQQNAQNLYAQGVNEANNLVTRYTNDFTTNTGQNKAKLTYLLSQAEQQKTAAQNTSTEQLLSRYAPQYLSAYAQSTAAEKPFSTPAGLFSYNPNTKTYSLVQGSTAQQSVTTPTGTVYSYNPSTGNVSGTGVNTFTGSTDSSGSNGYTANPAMGSFPQGAQQQPNSAAAVNNVSGMKQNGSFMPYNSPQDSFNATVADIQQKQAGNTTTGLNGQSSLSDFVNTWVTGKPNTPATGYTADNVAQYLQQMGMAGVTPQTPIGSINATQLATAVAHFETGYTPAGSSGSAPAGGTGTPVDPSGQDATSVLQAFDNLAANYSNPQQLSFASAAVSHYLQTGNIQGAWNYVQNQAIQQLPSSDRDNYNQYQTSIQQLQYAQSVLAQHPQLQTGLWSNLEQNAKKYFGANQTAAYTQFSAAINQASTATMHSLFGSRLTPSEMSKAAPFLVNDNDPVANAMTKINGEIGTLRYMSAQLVNQNILNQNIPNLTDYISSSNGTLPSQ